MKNFHLKSFSGNSGFNQRLLLLYIKCLSEIMCLYLTFQKTEAVERDSSRVLTVAVFQVTKYVMVPTTVVTTPMNLTVKVNDTSKLISEYLTVNT